MSDEPPIGKLLGHIDLVTHHRVVGWAADETLPRRALPVTVLANGRVVRRCRAEHERRDLKKAFGDSSGCYEYRAEIDPPLSPWIAHKIEVRVGNVTVGEVLLAPISVPQEAAPLPLMMMSMGRSGSTLLMGRLREHPSIIVSGPPPYEVKLLTYYTLALALMSGEADRALSLDPDRMGAHHNRYYIGRNPFNSSAYSKSPVLRNYWEHRLPGLLGASFRRAIVEHYDAEREAAGRGSFAVFAEKMEPNEFLCEGVRAMFPTARAILLVRDPRDTMCSYRKFWQGEPAECERLISNHLTLMLQMREKADLLLVRYEDLITDERRTLTRIWQYLGTPGIEIDRAAAPPVGHLTSTSIADSIGRWRKDLDESDKVRLSNVWENALATLGYPAD